MSSIRVCPILKEDVRRVAAFLHAHLNSRVSITQWTRAILVPWKVEAPNHGFMLFDAEDVVGAYLAFYSNRIISGQLERFCNLGAWCVLPKYRFHSLRLVHCLLDQPNYHFTDLSPSGNTIPVNTRLKFHFLDTTTMIIPNLPWPSWPGRDMITDDPAVLDRTLTGRDLEIYRDHAGTHGARHLVLSRGNESCYLIFRKERRKQLRLFASILYVGNPDLFRRMIWPLSRYLLFRYGALVTLAELRVVKLQPWPAFRMKSAKPKMYKSSLPHEQIDYLYSELVCLAW